MLRRSTPTRSTMQGKRTKEDVKAEQCRGNTGADISVLPVFKKPPFRCAEEGWGEFDMKITLTAMNKGGEHILDHDLNFAQERYENSQKVVRLPSSHHR
jgi:hypothetical protein